MIYENTDIYEKLIKKRKIFLNQDIDIIAASYITANLIYLDSLSNKEITIYINSVGGSVSDSLLTIYDTLQLIASPIQTICIGEAYSSAAIILAAGTKGKRFAYPNSSIMIHNLQIEEMSGNHKEIQEESKRIKKLNETLLNIISKHTGQNLKKVRKDCLKDKYMNAKEAIEYGIIDQIVISKK